MLLPVPSEVVMAFGGYLVVTGDLQGTFGIPAVLLLLTAGTTGNVTGAFIAYWIGRIGGIRFIERYGRYFLIDNRSIATAQRFFDRYGQLSVFGTRLLPIFRTFISIPAGIAQMNIRTFLLYTTLGTLIWDVVLVYLGITLGRNWERLIPFFDFLTYIVVTAIVVLFLYWLLNVLRKKRPGMARQAPPQ